MKSLKLILALTSAAAAVAFLSVNAAEVLKSPPATTNPAGCCATHVHAAAKPSRPVVGSPRGLATFPDSAATTTAKGEASAHCQAAAKGHGQMSCCK